MTLMSKDDAEEFLRLSQAELAGSLNVLKRQFVDTIRTFANIARRERFDNLKQGISAFRRDYQPELQEEILVDLDQRGANAQSIAFLTVKQTVKARKIRYGAKEAFNSFEAAIAKPILGIYNNPEGDEETKKSMDDLGFMLRAPIAVLASISFAALAPVWPFRVKTTNYHLDMDFITKQYQEKIVTPFIQALERDGVATLKGTLKRSSSVAKAVVEEALKVQKERYERERKEKDEPPERKCVAELVAVHSNFVAAEAAFLALKEKLERFV